MSGDRIDALAARLFQAAREERPARALRERVRGQGTSELSRSEASPTSGARSATRRTGLRRTAPWLATAGLLGAAAAVLLFWGERTLEPELEVRISAEARPPAIERALPEAAVAHRSALSEPSAAPPAVSADKSATSAEPIAAPRAPATAVLRPSPQPPAQAGAQPAESAPALPLAQQLTLLKQARALLRSGQSAEALAVLDRYGQHGGTDLRDEALLLRIEALAALGRSAEAAELARRFTSERPDSPLAERARRLGGLP